VFTESKIREIYGITNDFCQEFAVWHVNKNYIEYFVVLFKDVLSIFA